MRGSVIRRGRTWSVVYDEGRAENGRRVQRWRGGYRTKGEAEDALTKLRGALQTGDYVSPEHLTFKTFCEERWLPHAETVKRASTLETYRRNLERHIYPAIGGVPLQRLDASRLDRLYGELLAKGLAPGTVRFIAAVISSALRYAKSKRLVSRNVAEDAEPPKVERRRMNVWTDREVATFLDSVRDDRLFALWRFLVVTGARRGEALGLTWLALDLERGTARIEQQLVPVGKALVFSPPKTDSGIREVPLDDATIEVLREHREAQKIERALFGEDYVDHDLVFAHVDGRPLNPGGVSQAFQVRRKRAGLPHVRLHDLRHGLATMALAEHLPAELVRRRLGHSRIAVTVDLYQRHAVEEAERDVANLLAARIDERPLAGR
ncbi:MAG: site-specific integrase [Gaiellaceae bacterium]